MVGERDRGEGEQEPSTHPQQLKLKKQNSAQRGGEKSQSSKAGRSKQEQRASRREVDERKTSTRAESRLAGEAGDSGGAADHRGLDDEVDLGGERQHHLPGPDPGAVAKGAGGDCQWQPSEKVDRTSCTTEVYSSNF